MIRRYGIPIGLGVGVALIMSLAGMTTRVDTKLQQPAPYISVPPVPSTLPTDCTVLLPDGYVMHTDIFTAAKSGYKCQ
jgi:hypothetical protein